MFGNLFKSKFDPQKDMTIDVFIGAERVTEAVPGQAMRLVTNGLAARKRRELEVVGIPPELAPAAAVALNHVAAYVANEKEIKNGQSFGLRVGPCLMVGRGFEAVSHGQPVLRLGDISETAATETPPKQVIASTEWVRGLAVLESDPDTALNRWRQSVDFFPGDPTNAQYRFGEGQVVNQENHLTYLSLARHDSERAANWYRMALERSSVALAHELGGPLPDAAAREQVIEAAQQLVTALQDSAEILPLGGATTDPSEARGAELMAMFPAPMVLAFGNTLRRMVSVLPFPFRAYFYESPVREQLQNAQVYAVAAELYALAATDPVRVLELTRETRGIYLSELEALEPYGESDNAIPSKVFEYSAAPEVNVQLLSRILADLGRRLAAGLTLDEVRASLDLMNDAALKASAESKQNAQAEQEARYYMAAMDVG